MNPLYWLELRLRMSERRLWIIAVFFMVSMGVVAGVVLTSFWFRSLSPTADPSETGIGMTVGSLFFQAGLLCLLAPLATAGRLSMEREQRTLAALLNAPVPRRTIAAGKIKGAWIFTLWLAALTFPFLMLASLWGGLPLSRILLAFLLNLVCGLSLCTLAMGFSGLFGRSLMAYMAMGAFLFAWLALLPMLSSIGMAPIAAMEGGERTARILKEVVGYLTLYHNPFILLAQIFEGEDDFMLRDWIRMAYAPVVWLLMAWAGFGLSVRALKRDVI